VNSQQMTFLGAANAMIIFAVLAPPPFLPDWTIWLLGVTGAGIGFMLGKTNPGKAPVK